MSQTHSKFAWISLGKFVLKWKQTIILCLPPTLWPWCIFIQTKQLHFSPICFAPPFEKPSSFSMALNSFNHLHLAFSFGTLLVEGEHPTPWTTNDFVLHVHLGNSGGFLYETWRWCNLKWLCTFKTTKLNCQVIWRKLLIIWKKRSLVWHHFTICPHQELSVLEFDSLFRCTNPILNHCSWWWRHESLQWAAPACLLTAQGNLD